jgi:hypothetical protein
LDAEIGRIRIQGQSGPKVCKTLSQPTRPGGASLSLQICRKINGKSWLRHKCESLLKKYLKQKELVAWLKW